MRSCHLEGGSTFVVLADSVSSPQLQVSRLLCSTPAVIKLCSSVLRNTDQADICLYAYLPVPVCRAAP